MDSASHERADRAILLPAHRNRARLLHETSPEAACGGLWDAFLLSGGTTPRRYPRVTPPGGNDLMMVTTK